MLIVWNVIRWVCAITLALDGLLFLWGVLHLCLELKHNPQAYASCAPSRINEKHLLVLFGSSGIAFLALAILIVPL
jgi:hypothetical protein